MSYKHKWIETSLTKFIEFRNTVGAGRGIVAFIITAFKETTYLSVGLAFMGIDLRNYPVWIFPILAVLNTMGFWCLGIGWKKFKGFEISAAWGNQFNGMLKGIEKSVSSSRAPKKGASKEKLK